MYEVAYLFKIPAISHMCGRRKLSPYKQNDPALVVGGVAGVFGVGFPHTAALIGPPTEGAASGGEILSGGLCGLLGLDIADLSGVAIK